tara:strand:- start:784 stop:1032 length:249 start_codon:yes stop_codon:yes gene_type:complete
LSLLREYIKDILREANYVTIYAPLQSDLEQAIFLLKNNKQLKSKTEITKNNNIYTVRVQTKNKSKEIKKLINDRFGNFVKVM